MVVWSDETKFQLFGAEGCKYCWRKSTEPLKDQHIIPTTKFNKDSINIWGCFTYYSIGYLSRIEGNLNAELYRQILKEELMYSLRYYNLAPKDIIFQHDNDPKHKAKIVQRWLKNNKIRTISWPSKSPDLNPIENIWNNVKRRVNDLEININDKETLWNNLLEIWNETSEKTCKEYIETMPKRINDIIKAKGSYTRW